MTWSWQPALYLGIFFELLWLDLFPAGTFIPPHGLFALMTSICVLARLDEPNMRQTAVVLAASFPLAYFGAWLEQAMRTRHNLTYTALLDWNRRKGSLASPQAWFIVRALTEQYILFWGVFALGTALMLVGVRMVPAWVWTGAQPPWSLLWLAASIGAILALRIRTARVIGAVGLVLVLVANF